MFKQVLVLVLVFLLVGNAAALAQPPEGKGPNKAATGINASEIEAASQDSVSQNLANSDLTAQNTDKDATSDLKTPLGKRIRSMEQNRNCTQEDWKTLREELQELKNRFRIQQESRQEIKNMFKAAIRLAREQNRTQEAEQWLWDLLEIDPTDASAYQELGRLFQELGNIQPKLWCVGKQVYTKVPPVIKNGRILVPIRAVSQSLGAKVEWKADQQKVIISKGDITIILQLDKRVAIVNGKEYELDQPPQVSASRVIVPLRFVAETLKAKVDYYPEGQVVAINP